MAKTTSRYVCSNCGAESTTWAGRCHVCGEWNTLEEQLSEAQTESPEGQALVVQKVTSALNKDAKRLSIGVGEANIVFGGGIVDGSVSLIAGEPGIGKSTLMLQIASQIAKSKRVLYVSGEESAHQIALRAKRLNANSAKLELSTASITDDIATTILSKNYDLVIVDSIQTLSCKQLRSAAGSVSQITSSAYLLMSAAKQSSTAVIIVGHVTKEGVIAGPKVLEHIVDVVLELEGDRYGGFKTLRSIKNRFGPTNEVAIYEMVDEGLQAVSNPSKALLAERQVTDGSVVLATMEGSRPILVEVQALVNKTSYGYPKRAASGLDLNRVNLLVAMLERRTKLKLFDQDIYINIVGGIKVSEPAADLAVCMAIASAAKGMQLKKNAVVFGEIGLSGEIRHVPFIDKRLAEAKKLGFAAAIGPKDKNTKQTPILNSVKHIREALNQFLET